MGLRSQVIDTLFKGNRDPLSNIIHNVKGVATTPNGNVKALMGTFFCMVDSGTAADDDDIYINTDGGTTWSKIFDADAQHHLYLPTVDP